MMSSVGRVSILLIGHHRNGGLFGIINSVDPRNGLSCSLCFCRKSKHRGVTEMQVTSWLSKQICIGLKVDLRSLCINTEMLTLVT